MTVIPHEGAPDVTVEPVDLEEMETDLMRLRPLLRSVEDYLKSYWHDPRFAIRYAVGFLQLLQDESKTVMDLEGMTIQEIAPIETL